MLRTLYRFFSPFWLMKDASRGTFEERVAAYRHNRGKRGHLLACMARWALICSFTILLIAFFDAVGASQSGALNLFVLLSAVCGTFLTCGICVLFVTGYAYVYLSRYDR